MNKQGTLHFLIGKMGAGKSTYAKELSQQIPVVLISEDAWLEALYPGEIVNFDDYRIRHKKLLDVLGPHIQQLLQRGASVLLDFPANTIMARQRFLTLAADVDAEHQAIYLQVSDEQCLRQIEKRRQELEIEQPQRARFDTAEVFHAVTAHFQEPSESEGLQLQLVVS